MAGLGPFLQSSFAGFFSDQRVIFILYELLHKAKYRLLERAQLTMGPLPSPYSESPPALSFVSLEPSF